MRTRLVPIGLVAVALMWLQRGFAPGVAHADARQCGQVSPGDIEVGYSIRARGMSCKSARSLVRAYIYSGGPCGLGVSPCYLRGYRCVQRATKQRDALYRTGCRKGERAFSFAGDSERAGRD